MNDFKIAIISYGIGEIAGNGADILNLDSWLLSSYMINRDDSFDVDYWLFGKDEIIAAIKFYFGQKW